MSRTTGGSPYRSITAARIRISIPGPSRKLGSTVDVAYILRVPRIGDVIEIPTAKGLAYAQFTHKMPLYGRLIRVVEGIWRTRPHAFDEVINAPTRFFTFFPVAATVNQEVVSLVGNLPVPPQFADFPLMRESGLEPPGGGKVDWWLWDGKEKWRIGSLTPEQRML